MPNTFIDNRDRWLSLSDIDYVGQFVKSWLAFNAWYRNAYTEPTDRKIINELKWQANPILSKLRPLLSRDGEEAEQYRSEIGLLHHRLQGYEIHSGKGPDKQRISLEGIFLRDNPPFNKSITKQGYSFFVERMAGGQMKVEVKNRGGRIVFSSSQAKFHLVNLESEASFKALSMSAQGYLRGLYGEAIPHLVKNLKTGGEPPIKCGVYEFCCGEQALFAGVTEVLYLMRCTLFHGELNPTKDAVSCYEPAFRLVRRYLDAI